MFRDNSNKNLKYAIRKKKNGGGAASFIIGSVVLGGMMVSGLSPVKADTTDATANPDSTTDTSSTASSSATDSNEVALSNPSASTTATTASSEDTATTTTTPASDETATSTASTAPAAQPTAAANSTSTAPTTDAGTTSTTDVPASERGKATAKYVDEKGQVVLTKNITGYVGSYVDAATSLPAGYVLDDKDQTAANGKLAETPTELTVYVTAASNKRTGAQSASTTVDDSEAYPLSDGTADGIIKKADEMTKDQHTNHKINITNVEFSKDTIRESKGTDLTISFDWEGTGIKKGDILVTPMSDAFDSVTRKPTFNFSANGIADLGIMVLDYDHRRVISEFRKTLDPTKFYSGHISVGTYINRVNFPHLQNKATFTIPMPNGEVITKELNVNYDVAKEYDKVYAQAIAQKMNDSKTEADVRWAVEINPRGNINMYEPVLYITSDGISTTNPTYGRDGRVNAVNVYYEDLEHPSVIDGNSVEVYEANIVDSLGYTKGKKLEAGKDYELVQGSYDANTGKTNNNAWYIRFMGDYSVTNKQLVVEYGAHYTGLDPNVENGTDTNDERATATGVMMNTLLTYTYADQYGRPMADNYGREAYDGEIVGAVVNLINSNLTMDNSKDYSGSVIVEHLDADTKQPLKPDAYVVNAEGKTLQNVPVGTEYKTTPEHFDDYEYYDMDPRSANPTGEVIKGTTVVTYLYKHIVKGSVDVTYKTKDGKILEATTDVAKDVKVGTDYTTEEKSFPGYHFVGMDKTSDPAMGVVAEGTKHVIYLYEPDTTPEVKKGSVDVKHIATDGTVLEDVKPVETDALVGKDYTTKEGNFPGYHFVGMDKTSDPASGVVAEGTKHVIYVYAKDVTPEVKKGSVDVTYVTEDGKTLKATKDVVKDGEIGTAYDTTKESFDGYHFVRMGEFSADAKGNVTEGTQHVVYVYAKDVTPVEKKGSVDVKYVTKDGKVLKDVTTVKDNAPVGEDYTTEQRDFPGYHFVGMDKSSDPANGVVSEGAKHVVYVYEKDPEVKRGTVTVTYVDKDGNPLPGGEKTTVKDNVPVGEDYTTEEKDFPGYHFVGMDKTSDPANGTVTEGTKNVVYVYDSNKGTMNENGEETQQHGTVTVTYVDKDGNPLPGGEKTTIKDNVPVGEDYTTEEKDFPGYKFVGMKEGSADPSGKVVPGEQNVVYVYEKIPTIGTEKGEEKPNPENPTPVSPTATSEVPTPTPVQPSVVSHTTPSPAKVNVEKQALPQTGEEKNTNASALGVIALGLAGLFGLGAAKKKEEKDN